MKTTPPPITVIIPAYNEEARIAATVQAARALPGVTRVLVVDDGSRDATAARADAAGAEVLRQPRNAGKGAALRAGLAACPGTPEDILLLLDADLGATAAEAAKLLEPLLADEADLAIAQFPRPAGKAGFGLVKGLARWGTWLLTARVLQAPISGQRACRRWVLKSAPLADGYGIEIAMNIAAGDAGARIVEVPVTMTHAATGRDVRGFLHRGRQFTHILGTWLAALFGRTGDPLVRRLHPLRLLVWLAALGGNSWLLWKYLTFMTPMGELVSSVGVITFLLLFAPLSGAVCSGILLARKKNFRGRYIPALGGLCLLPVGLLLILPTLSYRRELLGGFGGAAAAQLDALRLWPIIGGFLLAWMFLGMLDDIHGDNERKGFRGHLQALCTGKLTTGGIKLLVGGLLAIGMAVFLPMQYAENRVVALPIAALLIALSANAMNLFDLRPGRALKVYWAVALPLAAVLIWFYLLPTIDPHLWTLLHVLLMPVLMVTLATLAFAPFDFAGMMMLGDTGANPLGAFLGAALALLLPVGLQAAAVVLLIGLHLYAERASITKLIEGKRLLRWLDALGRSA